MSALKSSRRTFLKGVAAGAVYTATGCSERTLEDAAKNVGGSLSGADRNRGHGVRDGKGSAVGRDAKKVKVLIVGGGVSGLSCGYELYKSGMDDFLLVELEDSLGGKSNSGINEYSKYPLGAHYITKTNHHHTELVKFYKEIGIIEGESDSGALIYTQKYRVGEPKERVHTGKKWSYGAQNLEGVLTQKDLDQQTRFYDHIAKFSQMKGSDGLFAFTIPVDMSSKDKEFTDLDRISFAEYLASEGYDSVPLIWAMEYGCRDDFGLGIDKISAWAGMHYFCSRNNYYVEGEDSPLFSWSEGNDWLVKKLKNPILGRCRAGVAAHKVVPANGGYRVHCYDYGVNKELVVECESLVMATPKVINQYLLKGIKEYIRVPEYAPWLVATLTVEPFDKLIAWDNYNYMGRGLGYIHNQHKTRLLDHEKHVITYYWPLSHKEPAETRKWMLSRSREDWNIDILRDLETMHPGISKKVDNIDIHLWGHGMVSPTVGSIWSDHRADDNKSIGRIHFAHSDMSGLSLFEEAFHHGNNAARSVIFDLGLG
jgi:hypothetical protein